MTILVTGASGTIGRQVLASLAGQDVRVQALTRTPETASFGAGVEAVGGSLEDPAALLQVLRGVSTLFLLVPNVADEVTQAMLALDAAREAGVKGIVYLSVFRGAHYADVPHFAGKALVERMIADAGLPATVLQPSYFMQNDNRQKDALLGGGVFAMPVGRVGLSMVDARDVGLAAGRELLRRERSNVPLPTETVPLVGPDVMDGPALAAIWGEALHRPIAYAGDNIAPVERMLSTMAPSWYVRDLVLMLRRYQRDGAAATDAEVAATARVLGRAPRSYRAFAEETASGWQSA